MNQTKHHLVEIMKIKGDAPLFLEAQVPPLCSPILVGDPKGDTLLRWVEKPSSRDTIYTWGVKATLDQVVAEMVSMAQQRGLDEGWGVDQVDEGQATKRLRGLGVDEVTVSGNLVHPTDPTLLGSVVLIGDKCFPILHNTRRALCVLTGGSGG